MIEWKKKYAILIILLIFLGFVSPLLSLLILIVILDCLRSRKFFFTAIFFSFFLSFINTTKEYESDLLGYFFTYEEALKYDFTTYLALFSKEPIYFTLQYVFSNLGFSFKFFLFGFTATCYLLLFSAGSRVISKMDGKKDYLFLILFFTFFFEIFNLSGHLLRQFFASVLLLYGLTFEAKRVQYSVAAVASLLHSSTFFFMILFNLKKELRIKRLLLSIIGIAILGVLLISLQNILYKIPYLGYVFERIFNNSDSFSTDVKMNSVAYFYTLFSIFLVLIWYLTQIRSRLSFLIPNIVLFNSIFVLIISNYNDLLAYRFFYYLYIFTSMLLLMLIERFRNQQLLFLFKILVISVLAIRFFYKVENSVWNFAPIENLLIMKL